MKALDNNISKKLHLNGLLYRIGLLNKTWLSPELADIDLMIKLARRMKENNYPCLNMTFHSTSLMAGLSPFVESQYDERLFLHKLTNFLSFVNKSGWKPYTLAQAGKLLVREGFI